MYLFYIRNNPHAQLCLAAHNQADLQLALCSGSGDCAHLAYPADLSLVPATVGPTVTYKGRVATQHDVEDHSQAPQVTALVVKRGLIREDLHHFWGHVFCRAALWGQGW